MDLVIVRAAQSTDFDAIRGLFKDLDRFHAAGEPGLLRVPNVSRVIRGELDEWITSENCFFAVAEVEGKVVGLIDASIRGPGDPTDQDRPWCGVHNLAVKSDWQRRGVGMQLMQATEEWAQKKGLADVRLNVFEFNRGARAFYEQLGYRVLSLQLHKDLPVELVLEK